MRGLLSVLSAQRVARLGPLHWLTLAIFAAIGLAAYVFHVPLNHEEVYSAKCLVPNLLFLNAIGFCGHFSFNPVSWSIGAEMMMYVGVPLLFWIMRRERRGSGSARCNGLAGADASSIDLVVHLECHLRLHSRNPILRLWSLALWDTERAGQVAICELGVLAGHTGLHRRMRNRCSAPYADADVVRDIAAGEAADAQQRPGRVVKTLAAGGQLTYSSYMLHPLVMVVLLNTAADHLLHAHGWIRVALIVLAFLIVWPVSYLSLVFFERPARRCLAGPNKKARDDAGLPVAESTVKNSLTHQRVQLPSLRGSRKTMIRRRRTT